MNLGISSTGCSPHFDFDIKDLIFCTNVDCWACKLQFFMYKDVFDWLVDVLGGVFQKIDLERLLPQQTVASPGFPHFSLIDFFFCLIIGKDWVLTTYLCCFSHSFLVIRIKLYLKIWKITIFNKGTEKISRNGMQRKLFVCELSMNNGSHDFKYKGYRWFPIASYLKGKHYLL